MGALSPGTLFAGYEIEGTVARGGMGIIYRAQEQQPRRMVALKVVAPEFAGEGDFRSRFLRESQLAAAIEHPHVVPVFRVGEEAGTLFLAMRLIQGHDLSAQIAPEGRLNPVLAAQIVDQIADALDTAHQQGLVHRDVKPSNVLVESRRRGPHIYLTDFGLTKDAGAGSGVTRSGTIVGTVDYMAPEQLAGQRVDARADVYSLGCLLFQALTGQVPYPRGRLEAVMYAHLHSSPPRASDLVDGVPREFDEIIGRALAKDPDARFASAGDLGGAAIAASQSAMRRRTERSVAVGMAAPPARGPGADDRPVGGGAGPLTGNRPAPIALITATEEARLLREIELSERASDREEYEMLRAIDQAVNRPDNVAEAFTETTIAEPDTGEKRESDLD